VSLLLGEEEKIRKTGWGGESWGVDRGVEWSPIFYGRCEVGSGDIEHYWI